MDTITCAMEKNAECTRHLLCSVTKLFCAMYRRKNVQDVQQYVTQITGLKNKQWGVYTIHSECVTIPDEHRKEGPPVSILYCISMG